MGKTSPKPIDKVKPETVKKAKPETVRKAKPETIKKAKPETGKKVRPAQAKTKKYSEMTLDELLAVEHSPGANVDADTDLDELLGIKTEDMSLDELLDDYTDDALDPPLKMLDDVIHDASQAKQKTDGRKAVKNKARKPQKRDDDVSLDDLLDELLPKGGLESALNDEAEFEKALNAVGDTEDAAIGGLTLDELLGPETPEERKQMEELSLEDLLGPEPIGGQAQDDIDDLQARRRQQPHRRPHLLHPKQLRARRQRQPHRRPRLEWSSANLRWMSCRELHSV